MRSGISRITAFLVALLTASALGGSTAGVAQAAVTVAARPVVQISTPACGDLEFPTASTGSWVIPGGGVDVFSNGPSDEGTGSDCVHGQSIVNKVDAGEMWQCPEFVNRLYLTKGWISSAWTGNAGEPMWNSTPVNLSKQANGSVSYLGPGDVVIINVYLNGSFEGGHALVVNDSSQVTSGTVNLVSQNSGSLTNSEPVVSGTLSNGSVTVGGGGDGWSYSTIGIVHAPGGASTGALAATTRLAITAPSGYYLYAPIDETFTVTNESGAPASIQRLVVAFLDPHNVNYDENCATGLALAAGQSYTCDVSGTWGSAGTYTAWADWEDYSGNWHQGQLGTNQTFTLASAPTLVAVAPLVISAPSGYYKYAPLDESFTVTNESGAPASIQRLIVGFLDPSGANYDENCATGLALAASQSYTCHVSGAWGSAGTYTAWADWEDYSGNWHQGQLGPNQTFALAPAPTLVATAPLTITAPSGYYQYAPIREKFTVTNESGAPASIQRLIVGLLDPSGANYDENCATGLALAAGQSHTCDITAPWGSAGTYIAWADWEDYNGNWHQGELGPNQTFTLAPADTIATTTLPAGTVSKPYAATMTALGGTTPYTFTIASGSLPAGLTLSPSGQITGAPATAGTTKATIMVTDSSSPALTATRALTIRIAKAATKTTLTMSAAKVAYGQEQTERLTAAVAPQYPGREPTGKVTIRAASTIICTITLTAGHGTCHLTKAKLKAGTYHLTATYAATIDFSRSASPPKKLTITREPA